jgi:hypothetical protein
MTRMSDPRRGTRARGGANQVISQAGSPLARTLHDRSLVVRALAFSLLAGGCVLPPSLSTSQADAGENSPPAILSASSDLVQLVEPGPVSFAMGTSSTLNVALRDADLTDTLYVRLFVDYNHPDPTPARVAGCNANPTGKPDRTAICSLDGLCQSGDVGVTRGLTIVVFDREPLDDGTTPLYQAMPTGGLSTDRFYYLQCQ